MMNHKNNVKNNASFDAANLRIEAPVLPYSDEAPQFQIVAEPQATVTATASVTMPTVAAPQSRGPQKRQRAARQRANTAHSKSSRHQVSHPELVRILMTSQTNAMPVSPTNPASAKVRPTAAIQKGPVRQRMNAQQVHMAQQMDREKQMVLRGLGIVVGLVMLLIVGVKCFADTPEPKIQALAALPPKTEEAKTSADSKVKEGGVADVKSPDRVPVEMIINEVPSPEKSKKFWPAEVSLYPASDAPRATSVREASTSTLATFRQPNALRFLELPADLRRAMPVVQKKTPAVVKVAATPSPPVNPAPARTSILPLAEKAAPVIPPAQAKELARLFVEMRDSFWKSESAVEKRAFDTNVSMERPDRIAMFLPGLSPKDSISGGYYYCGEVTDSFLRLAKKIDLQDDPRLPTVLYLGAMAHYTLGHYDRALIHLERLRAEYADYKRPQYLNDRENPDQRTSVPVQASVAKLIFCLRVRTLTSEPSKALANLQQITSDAATALSLQRNYAQWISAQSSMYNIRSFDESLWGSEPDQRRAAALPSTLDQLREAWDKILPVAISAVGMNPVRDWLHALILTGGPVNKMAELELRSLTGRQAAQIKRDAELALAAKQYDSAKSLLVALRDEYPDNEDLVQFATTQMSEVVQGFKNQADSEFDPTNFRGQAGALSAYQKLLENTSDPTLQGYAEFRIGSSLGTLGNYAEAIAHIEKSISRWETIALKDKPEITPDVTGPRSASGAAPLYYIEDANYYRSFYYGASLRQRDQGIGMAQEFIRNFPGSKWAPESAFDIVMWYWASNRPKEAAQACHDVIEKFPASIRAEAARDLLSSEFKGL